MNDIHLVQNLSTREFAPATHGVMFAAHGYCGNTHFCTIEDALADFDRQVAQVIAAYKAAAATANYHITEIENTGKIIKQIEIVNVKKNGQPGKIKNTVRLYTLEAAKGAR